MILQSWNSCLVGIFGEENLDSEVKGGSFLDNHWNEDHKVGLRG